MNPHHPHSPYVGGHLEVICGPMFSGKSEELMRRLRRATIARQRVALFKPALDTRHAPGAVVSHAGARLEAQPVSDLAALRLLPGPPEVVAFDEAQFFGPELLPLALALADAGARVLLAGLDLDFRGEPFEPLPALLAHAESVDKLSAICMVCGAPATRTQRLIAGRAARRGDPLVLIGAAESYEARCRLHHEVRE